MDKSKRIKIVLLVCAALFLLAAISLFAEGDIASGACGLVIAAVLGIVGFRKRQTAGTHRKENRYPWIVCRLRRRR